MDPQEFFSVQHGLTANVEPLVDGYTLPEMDDFIAEIPTPFMVASEFSTLDTLTDRAINELKNSDLTYVVQLLDAQNSKLNLLLTFMLSQQNEAKFAHTTVSFGASQFSYLANRPLKRGQLVRVKLFLERPAAAIYCYGQVSNSEPSDQHSMMTISFVRLRDEDQDLLIKAALFQQQKLLRQRSRDRDENK